MPNNAKVNDYKSRAQTVRKIAQGLYDKVERQTVLELVDDFEEMAASKESSSRHILSNGGSAVQQSRNSD